MAKSVQRLMYGALVVLFAAGLAWAGTTSSDAASPPSRALHGSTGPGTAGAAVPPSLRRAIDNTLGQDWSQQAEFTASDGSPGDEFGISIALSADGHTALVGAPDAYIVSGAVYVFTNNYGDWGEIAEICCGFEGDAFGSAVALSADGTTGLIGSPGYTTYPLLENGTVYVYTGGNWSGYAARLEAGDEGIFNYFGEALALSADGSTALIGADGHNSNAGSAYVFTGSGSNWSQQAELTASDGSPGDEFAYSLALSPDGTTALIGSPYLSNRGAAYVFNESGGSWSQSAELMASDGMQQDYFGDSVALSGEGTTGLIGAVGHSFNGAAYVFTDSGGTWSQQAELAPPPLPSGDAFGSGVALASDGATALVGASDDNSGIGAAYVFTGSGGNWSRQAEFVASDGMAGDYFGDAVGLSANAATALVGAYGRNGFTGAAYVFTQPMTQAQTLFEPSSGSSGSTTHLLGTGFAPGETVALSIGRLSDQVQANANGRFNIALRVPNVPPHTYTFTAMGETSGLTAHATFTVTASGPQTSPSAPSDWTIGDHRFASRGR